MTEQQPIDGHPIIHAQAFVPVPAESSSRLSQLHAAYPAAKAAADAAAEQLKAITDGIKAELAAAAPEGALKIALTGDDGPPMQLTYAESWRLDSKRLKREDPESYVRYAVKGGSWTLKQVKGGEPE